MQMPPESDVRQALMGGALIAASSTLHLMYHGRVTGLSGMLFSLQTKANEWADTFLLGLVAPAVYAKTTYGSGTAGYVFFDSDASVAGRLGAVGWVLSGLAVGYGTKLGNGCTSGHGVCGLPRLSPRSLAATLTFCATGLLTRNVVAALPAAADVLNAGALPAGPAADTQALLLKGLLAGLALKAFYGFAQARRQAVDEAVTLGCGLLFGTGLLLSGMLRPSKVLGFLNGPGANFDAQLVFVLGSVVLINLATFSVVLRRNPVKGSFNFPRSRDVDNSLLLGAAVFGMGWGMAGICPGPGIITLFTSSGCHMALWIAAVLAGQRLAVQSKHKIH